MAGGDGGPSLAASLQQNVLNQKWELAIRAKPEMTGSAAAEPHPRRLSNLQRKGAPDRRRFA